MFSVVIPLYNKSHTIERTLGSVLAQSFKDFEIIVIDDGSTDDGVELIKRVYKDKRIKVFSQKNQGVSVARNRGVAEARFEHVAFLDGDDAWMPDYLLKMKEAIEKLPEAGMYCCAGVVRDSQAEHYRLAKKYAHQILEVNYFENPHVFSHTSATIVKKSIFLTTVGFPVGMKCNQDFALFYAMALVSKVVYCGEMLSIYNGDIDGQITSSSDEKRFALLAHVVNRVNLCYTLWKKSNKSNKLYMVFDKYETRTRMLGFLKNLDYRSIKYYSTSLNIEILNYFPTFEFWLYQQKKLNFFARMYIYLTKIKWRMNRFPVAGEVKSNYKKI